MTTVSHRGLYVPDAWLSDVAGVHRTTIARWRRAQAVPRAVSLLIRVMHDGELGLVHEAWTDFKLDRRCGSLWTPESYPCRAADLLSIRYRTDQLRALEHELAIARAARQLPLWAA